MSKRKKLVVIGNGMAPGRALERLCENAPNTYDITIFNAEPRVNYDRIMLSPVLAGEKSYSDIIIHSEEWYTDRDIKLHQGKAVAAIDRNASTVTAADGTSLWYDKLVIATGSTPFIIPVPGHDLAGVITYRDLDDVERMIDAAAPGGQSAVVIGGGLLGLEAAAGLAARGMAVTVLHLMDTLMERQLDQTAGDLLKGELARRGITVLTGANTAEVLGDDRVTGVALTDGSVIPADLVVMAVGIRPSVALAKAAGLTVGRGIIVDDTMRTSDPKIFAVGECVEHRGACYGLVAPLYEMAEVLADQLAGGAGAFTGSVTSTKLKVTGIDLFSAGDFAPGNDRDDIVLSDEQAGVYKRVVLKDGRIHGVVLYGDTADGAWYFKMLRDGTHVSYQRDMLIFGANFAESPPLDPTVAAVAWPVKPAGHSGVTMMIAANSNEVRTPNSHTTEAA